MTYASIMVHVQADDSAMPRLACARALADTFDATLIGVGAEMVPPMTFDSPYMSMQADWVIALRENAETNLKNAAKAFKSASLNLSKPAIWECGLRLPTDAVARASRAADLIVASAGPHKDPYRDVSAGDLIVTAGRPVLVVAPREHTLFGRRILLAWKDTREARRALSDAMPFFEQAEEVLVLAVCAEEEKDSATAQTNDVVAALGRHGVTARAEVVVHKSANAHEIMRCASRFGADMIVAGGYGHSRAGEWVFGGVTRDLLDQSDTHVLLSH